MFVNEANIYAWIDIAKAKIDASRALMFAYTMTIYMPKISGSNLSLVITVPVQIININSWTQWYVLSEIIVCDLSSAMQFQTLGH